MRFLGCTHEESISRAGGALSRGVWGHAPSENFEIWGLGNAIFCVFSGGTFSINKYVVKRNSSCLFYLCVSQLDKCYR